MRSVIVTGGSRGIGLSIARGLSGSGYQVVAVARRMTDDLAEAVESAARAGEGAIRFKPFDLNDVAGLPGLTKELRREFGSFYALVNNAGLGAHSLLVNTADSQIEDLFRLNAISPIALTKHVARSMMVDGSGGRIVSIASVAASTGYRALSVYGATKAALVGFTRSFAREVGRLDITVNAIAPGFVETAMTDDLSVEGRERILRRAALGRFAQADDVASAAAFLLSDGARNITGTVLTVDAGNTA